MTRFGVIGTSRGVGKTVVASAIIVAMRETGARVSAMKPIGLTGASDAAQLEAACGIQISRNLLQPVTLPDASAPLVAARRAHEPVDIPVLDRAFAELCATSDAVVVEDSGGLLTPITETENFATLFRRWGLDLVIVSPNGTGTVNETLMTLEVSRAAGLRVRAIVLTTLTDRRPGAAERTNQALLKELLLTIPVICVPFSRSPNDPRQLASFARELVAQPTVMRPA